MPIIGGCTPGLFGNTGGPEVIDLRNALNSSAASASDVMKQEQQSRGDWTKWLFSSRVFGQNSAQSVPETQTSIYAALFKGRA